MWWLFLLAFVIFYVLFFTRRNRRMMLLYKQIPSDSLCLPIIGHTYKYLGNDEDKMKAFQIHGKEAMSKGGIMGLWHAKVLYIMVSDPVASEYILKHCLQKDDLLKVIQVLTGNGSIFASVPIWRPRRKVLAPSFSMKNLNSFVPVFSKQNLVLTDKLEAVAGKGSVSMWNYLTTYTMDAVCETTLGIELNTQKNPNNPFLNAVSELFHVAVARMSAPWLHSDFVFTKMPIYSKVMEYKKLIYDFIDKIIEQRRKYYTEQVISHQDFKAESFKTFINMMIESSGDDEGYTNLELREEALVLIVAGTDTSAVGLAFTMTMLSRYPDVQEKVFQELQEVFGDSDRPVVAEDLPRLKYLEAVVKESMRLYPPVPIIARKLESDLTLPSGITLVKDCGIFINIWAIHRNPLYWGLDAEDFRPERFIGAPLKHPAAFMPFSNGPRGCLGYQYAYMSMKTTIANIVRRYQVLPAPDPVSGKLPLKDEPLKLKFDIMMRHVDNYMVCLENRHNNYNNVDKTIN